MSAIRLDEERLRKAIRRREEKSMKVDANSASERCLSALSECYHETKSMLREMQFVTRFDSRFF